MGHEWARAGEGGVWEEPAELLGAAAVGIAFDLPDPSHQLPGAWGTDVLSLTCVHSSKATQAAVVWYSKVPTADLQDVFQVSLCRRWGRLTTKVRPQPTATLPTDDPLLVSLSLSPGVGAPDVPTVSAM